MLDRPNQLAVGDTNKNQHLLKTTTAASDTYIRIDRNDHRTNSNSREGLGDESRATVLSEDSVGLSRVGHAVREQQRILRREHIVHERPHGRLVRLVLGGGRAEHLGEPEIFRLIGFRCHYKKRKRSDGLKIRRYIRPSLGMRDP